MPKFFMKELMLIILLKYNIFMKKAQTLVFEQVLLFMISVAIFVACFGVFNLYQAHFSSISMNDQARGIRDMISAQVIQLIKFEDLNVSVKLPIPRTISGEGYFIVFNGSAINVSAPKSGVYAISDFYNLSGRYTFLGEARSGKGKIIIYKKGYNIRLE